MPYHKSVEKNIRQSEKAALKNKSARSAMRTAVKSVLTTTDKTQAETALRKAVSILDKSSKVGLIHKNNAANKKSQLAKKVKSLA